MSIELIIAKEFANICITHTELSSIEAILTSEIGNKDFIAQLNKVTSPLDKSYAVISDNLRPFLELNSEAAFISRFDDLFARYKSVYLTESSKPRTYTDEAFEAYLMLRTLKETRIHIITATPL
ncbi:hypothetical protein AU255_15445 [Methyloprofundus sedimenti]|uniref:Uncharacterized protein n=1 Tax=Methyloprofundus sedimenti TaxID=1420851 RepID=A0A1V8M299_9GAMM|nr:hypothetical protein [Methyloprofundus sedimenti]OQK15616.1 hypothetical protein AU255_15445 [Methyloprofundus sedimenti]